MKRTPLNSPHARLRVAGRNLAAQSQSWRDLDLRAKALISLVVAVGTGVLLYAAVYPTSKNIAQFICYLLIAILAARLKVDRKSTRLNSSHVEISYAVFCLKKKNI